MDDNDIDDLFTLVVQMRTWQMAYFRDRSLLALRRAKAYERLVDTRLKVWMNSLSETQGVLDI